MCTLHKSSEQTKIRSFFEKLTKIVEVLKKINNKVVFCFQDFENDLCVQVSQRHLVGSFEFD